MAKVEKLKPQSLKSKRLYKFELILLKFIPFILAIACLLNTILSYFGIDLAILTYLCGISFFTLLFLFVSSYVFKFCLYHRLPLYYVIINNLLAIYDYHIGIPLSDKNLLILYLIIAWIFYILILIDYVDADKKYTKPNN